MTEDVLLVTEEEEERQPSGACRPACDEKRKEGLGCLALADVNVYQRAIGWHGR